MILRPRSLRGPAALLLLASHPVPGLAQKPPKPPPGFDTYVADVLKAFTVPGVAIAIV
jgi:hypothetical protein